MADAAIRAIETRYNGHRFRSRLEARWAVFFDGLGVPYEYEKEGFDLGAAGQYLPDFWLPTIWLHREKQGAWVEVKATGRAVLDSQEKFAAMANAGQDLVVVVGEPYLVSPGVGYLACPIHGVDNAIGVPVPCAAPSCDCLLWVDPDRLREAVAIFGSEEAYLPRWRSALDQSRSARFEHGESG